MGVNLIEFWENLIKFWVMSCIILNTTAKK